MSRVECEREREREREREGERERETLRPTAAPTRHIPIVMVLLSIAAERGGWRTARPRHLGGWRTGRPAALVCSARSNRTMQHYLCSSRSDILCRRPHRAPITSKYTHICDNQLEMGTDSLLAVTFENRAIRTTKYTKID